MKIFEKYCYIKLYRYFYVLSYSGKVKFYHYIEFLLYIVYQISVYQGLTVDQNIHDHSETTHENEPKIIKQKVFLPPDIKELLKSISRTECSSEQLGRLAGFFLILDRSVLNNWNLDLLVQKLLAIVQKLQIVILCLQLKP